MKVKPKLDQRATRWRYSFANVFVRTWEWVGF